MRDRMANLPPTQSIKRKTEGDSEKVCISVITKTVYKCDIYTYCVRWALPKVYI